MSFLSANDTVARLVGLQRAYTFTTDLNSLGNGEQPYALLKNPAGSGYPIVVTHFLFGVDSSTARSIFRIYADPTITDNGTALTIVNTYVTSSPRASTSEAYVNPTVSDNGQILNMAIAPANTPSRGISRNYWIDPGHSILATIENSVPSASSFADIYWTEDV